MITLVRTVRVYGTEKQEFNRQFPYFCSVSFMFTVVTEFIVISCIFEIVIGMQSGLINCMM